METLIYQTSPVVTFATNKFIRVPVILQYEDTPLLEVIQTAEAGYTSQFSIYHADGTDLARVVGSQLYPTEAGKKAGLKLRHPDRMTVCEMDGRTVFELTREDAAVLKTAAELYTPDGAFLKSSDEGITGQILQKNDRPLQIGGLTLVHNTIEGRRIGIRVHRDGRIGIGVNT
jgi:hypothetical protein